MLQSVDPLTHKKKLVKRSYSDYLSERYFKTIADKEQPLLVTTGGICLVPEVCFITGLSEETQNSPSKFNLIRDIVNSTQPDMMRRLVDIKRDFLDVIEKGMQMEDIKISMTPHIMDA